MALFIAMDYSIVPTPYGKLYLPKKGYSSGRILTYIMDMVEPQCALYFEELVKYAKETVLVDIGAAADGWYSIKACKLNPKIRVIAVEPSSYEYGWLINNLDSNSCRGRVFPLKVALGNTTEVLNLNGEEVRCMKLDDLLTTIGVTLKEVKILKIDVEGMGLRVIKGALKTLQKGIPVIFLEVHNEEEAEAKELLENLGYKVAVLPGSMYIAVPNEVISRAKSRS